METSNISGAGANGSKGSIVRVQSVLIVAAIVAVLGWVLATQTELQSTVLVETQSPNAASVEQVITLPAEEHQPEALYQTATNGNYEAAIEAKKALAEWDRQRLEEAARIAEASRAAGYMNGEEEMY